MLKATFKNGIILGLSDINLVKLKEGKPIMFNLKELLSNLDVEIIIFNGKTEEAMAKEIRETFHINAKTKIKDQR